MSHARAINWVRNLQYGPKTRLIRDISSQSQYVTWRISNDMARRVGDCEFVSGRMRLFFFVSSFLFFFLFFFFFFSFRLVVFFLVNAVLFCRFRKRSVCLFLIRNLAKKAYVN